MADRPILFSAAMINAMLAGRKTQTRRLIATTKADTAPGQILIFEGPRFGGTAYRFDSRYAVGDRIWIRETYFQRDHWEPVAGRQTKGGRQKWAFVAADDEILFDPPASFRKGRHSADPATVAWHQRLGRFMPRAASRLTLIVDDVRVERLQAISDEDAIAEGVTCWVCGGPADGTSENDCACFHTKAVAVASYALLWETLHGAGGWDANPFVVAVRFRVVRGNIDQVPA